LAYLCCPSCQGDLTLEEATRGAHSRIESGVLRCTGCSNKAPIVRSVPRFVPRGNYAASFGLEWTRHATTQYDSHSGIDFSRKRFFEETGWPARMDGQLILEAGCGSGRFTEQAAKTGAAVVSFDLSYAVDASYATNGALDNVLIVQADILRIPFRDASFDKVFCFGVLQHTPDPRRSFLALPRLLKPGGQIVADVYKKTFLRYVLGTKYWVRPFTRNMDPETLYRAVRRYVDFMWPIAEYVRRIPKIGVPLNWRLLIGDYTNEGVPTAQLREWAYLDTFDMLAPKYDFPQTLSTVRRWFEEASLTEIDVRFGYNGIQGRGIRSPATAA
jgi:SAM-dependent methyltransferase